MLWNDYAFILNIYILELLVFSVNIIILTLLYYINDFFFLFFFFSQGLYIVQASLELVVMLLPHTLEG